MALNDKKNDDGLCRPPEFADLRALETTGWTVMRHADTQPNGSHPDQDDYESVCGETFDHDLTTDGPIDGLTVYRCQRCGAEILEEDEELLA